MVKNTSRTGSCPICGSRDCIRLPASPGRSMRSDGKVEPQSLGKFSCLGCGTVFRATKQRFKTLAQLDDYTLNAAADNSFDDSRQDVYARAVADALQAPPDRVIDVGCGNGALLRRLSTWWPEAALVGVEPAPLPRGVAAHGGLQVHAFLDRSLRSDLVISVNVIEHTPDPASFLQQLARAVVPHGSCVLVWPADAAPSTELLFNDHLFTLSTELVSELALAAGLVTQRRLRAPDGFQGLHLRRRTMARGSSPVLAEACQRRAALALARDRVRYMRRWVQLGEALLHRVDPSRQLVGFGTGEAANYLRAYAPALWACVRSLSADEVRGDRAMGLPLLAPAELDPSKHQILLATHPRWHRRLQERFEAAGFDCLAWDHLIPQ